MAHPYTEGLFNSLPNLRERGEELEPIKGMMPNPMEKIVGCSFAPRCQYATEKCFKEQPFLEAVSKSHLVACFNNKKFFSKEAK